MKLNLHKKMKSPAGAGRAGQSGMPLHASMKDWISAV
jgi:glycine cleavage system protein P-like pyridoxal-binding family